MELFNVGPIELLFLLALAILVLGPQRATELAGQLGRLLAGLRRNVNALRSELSQSLEEESRPSSGATDQAGSVEEGGAPGHPHASASSEEQAASEDTEGKVP